MFPNQCSQGQAVSASKHGRVCAQGCCHRPRRGHLGTGPRRRATGQTGAALDSHRPPWALLEPLGPGTPCGGASLQNPPGASLLPPPQQVRAPISTGREPHHSVCQGHSCPQVKVTGRGLKAFGDRMRYTGHLHALPAESLPVLFHNRNGFSP